jgi:hypothetical protein
MPHTQLGIADFEEFNCRDDHCVSLKEMMSNTSTALLSDQECNIALLLLVFPAEMVLDNVILSGDPEEIEKMKLGNRYSIDDKIVSMFLYWMIAIHWSSHRIKQKGEGLQQISF